MICEKCGSSNNIPDSFINGYKDHLKKLVDKGAFMDVTFTANKIAKLLGLGVVKITTDDNLLAIRNSEISLWVSLTLQMCQDAGGFDEKDALDRLSPDGDIKG